MLNTDRLRIIIEAINNGNRDMLVSNLDGLRPELAVRYIINAVNRTNCTKTFDEVDRLIDDEPIEFKNKLFILVSGTQPDKILNIIEHFTEAGFYLFETGKKPSSGNKMGWLVPKGKTANDIANIMMKLEVSCALWQLGDKLAATRERFIVRKETMNDVFYQNVRRKLIEENCVCIEGSSQPIWEVFGEKPNLSQLSPDQWAPIN